VVDREDYARAETGKMKLVTGRARFTSRITHDSSLLSFGVLHFGDHNITGGVREFNGEKNTRRIRKNFMRRSREQILPKSSICWIATSIRTYIPLKSLFRDDQRKILDIILSSTRPRPKIVCASNIRNMLP